MSLPSGQTREAQPISAVLADRAGALWVGRSDCRDSRGAVWRSRDQGASFQRLRIADSETSAVALVADGRRAGYLVASTAHLLSC